MTTHETHEWDVWIMFILLCDVSEWVWFMCCHCRLWEEKYKLYFSYNSHFRAQTMTMKICCIITTMLIVLSKVLRTKLSYRAHSKSFQMFINHLSFMAPHQLLMMMTMIELYLMSVKLHVMSSLNWWEFTQNRKQQLQHTWYDNYVQHTSNFHTFGTTECDSEHGTWVSVVEKRQPCPNQQICAIHHLHFALLFSSLVPTRYTWECWRWEVSATQRKRAKSCMKFLRDHNTM